MSLTPARGTEVIFERGDSCDSMVFVEQGDLCYSIKHHLKQSVLEWAGTRSTRQSVMSLRTFGTGDFDSSIKDHLEGIDVNAGMWLAEAALWVQWRNQGELVATSACQLLYLSADKFSKISKQFTDATAICGVYSRAFCGNMSGVYPLSDIQTDLPPPNVADFCLNWSETPSRIDTPSQCQDQAPYHSESASQSD